MRATAAFVLAASTFGLLTWPASPQPAEPMVAFQAEAGKLGIRVGGRPFATYVFQDAQLPRPYFAHVHNPDGVQVTRNHPPVAGADLTDHATFHPGLWLAFGDLGGADFWRNRAAVRHVEFVEKPQAGRFAVRNRYEADGKAICAEVCRYTIQARPHGILLLWESEFQSEQPFAFGDQEEMGLGVRVATPLSVQKGGRIVNSAGLKNEAQVWGKQADWCTYEGEINGRKAGVLLMPDPRNFRPSWFHARDYGLLVANPFGRQALSRGAKSQVQVRPSETFRLRFGVLTYAGPTDLAAAYADYLKVAGARGGAER